MKKFVNPYNFIPFGEANKMVKADKDDYYKNNGELNTGWLDVALYTKTPLIIPDGAHPTYIDPETKEEVKNPSEENKRKLHKKYKFMGSFEGECFVPGSEIRGMIRSVYEAATNSCVPEILHKKPISHRLPMTASISKRGLLQYKDNRWVLYSSIATKIGVNFETIKNGKKIINKIINKDDGTEIKQKNGTSTDNYGTFLQYNIPVVKKNNHIAYLKADKEIYRWDVGDDTPYKNLLSTLKRDDVPNKGNNPNYRPQKELLQVLDNATKNNNQMVPVYYFIVKDGKKDIVYVSGSSIGRIASNRKWNEIMGAHAPCKDGKLCPACLLFGTIKKGGLKGRVRFTDAYSEDIESVEKKFHTLDVLAGPRYSAFEFYFRKPEKDAYLEDFKFVEKKYHTLDVLAGPRYSAFKFYIRKLKYWNADFYSATTMRIYSEEKKVNNVTFYHMDSATPRGRKMYWHSMPKADEAKINNMNSTMEAVKSNKPFRFKIYFDQITDEQLKALIWTISLGDNKEESNLQHKLGHAKPLGYGSVKLVVEACKKRCLKRDDVGNYSYLIEDVPKILLGDLKNALIDVENVSVKSLIAMADMKKTEGKEVRYPRYINNKKQDDIYNWFSENRNTRNSNISFSTLPEPTDDNIELLGSWNDSVANNQVNDETEVVEAKVFRVDKYKNVVLEKSSRIEMYSRIRSQDTNGREFKIGEVVRVIYVDQNTNSNGKTFRNYKLADKQS